VLPVERRVRRPAEFAAVVRDGRRAGTPGLVVHIASTPHPTPARAGFVIARNVGPAVVRNRIRRRLRHLVRPRLDAMPDGTDLVIRVLPAAAGLARPELAATFTTVLDRALAASS
jgi:ribonuclease P protein component